MSAGFTGGRLLMTTTGAGQGGMLMSGGGQVAGSVGGSTRPGEPPIPSPPFSQISRSGLAGSNRPAGKQFGGGATSPGGGKSPGCGPIRSAPGQSPPRGTQIPS